MNKVYTIIDIWEDDGVSCWVKNYVNRDDCFAMFKEVLSRRDMLTNDGNTIQFDMFAGCPIEDVFDNLVSTGQSFHYCSESGMEGCLFVRHQELNSKFSIDQCPD